MNHRLPQTNPTPSFGLVGWLEQTRVRLPLKGVECQFHVCGELLNVQIDQIFHQDCAQAMDCLYSFPLPAGAAVYRCEMHVNGRIIRAIVEEKVRAREIAREQKAAGRRTALVEMERENLFTLSLGNIQPGDVVVIRFAYIETLTRLGDWTSLRIPFCPGVRYITGKPLLRSLRGKGAADDTDQVPDASRLSPPRMDALHPDAAYLSMQGVIEDQLGLLKDVSSASHPVVVTDGQKQFRISLADRETMPDGDFALRWTETRAAQLQSAGWSFRVGKETYALALLQAPRIEGDGKSSPQDFYFLVDRSGSMAGLKWQKAVESLRAFIEQLSPEDRVWLTFFSDTHRDFAEKPLTTSDLQADGNLSTLESLGTEGGTELLPALRHVLDAMNKHSVRRDQALILITDGQVGNESAILDSLRAHPRLRVHCFGIDTAVNDALLSRLASQQRGSCCLLQPTDDIVGAVARLGARLHHPVVTSITAGDGWEMPGAAVPDLHSDEVLSLSLKINSANAREVVVRGRLSDGREEIFRLPLIERAEPAIRLLWARSRIRHHLDQKQTVQALTLAKQTNLLCEGAAFIAWDESEKVAIAEREVYQPSMALCEDVNLDHAMTHFFAAGRSPRLVDDETRLLASFSRHASSGTDLLQQALSALLQHGATAGSSASSVGRELERLLVKLCGLSGIRAHPAQVSRLVGSYERFIKACPLQQVGRNFILLLMEWILAGGAQAETRMKCAEELIESWEVDGPDPKKGLAVARRWVKRAVPKSESFHARFQALLKEASKHIPATSVLEKVLKKLHRSQ